MGAGQLVSAEGVFESWTEENPYYKHGQTKEHKPTHFLFVLSSKSCPEQDYSQGTTKAMKSANQPLGAVHELQPPSGRFESLLSF